jgi:metal-sulfur cluster biosynthetic enzyme
MLPPERHDPLYQEKLLAVDALRRVLDPELGVNVVDLGLIYDLDFSHQGLIRVQMTFTTAFCPLGESLVFGVENVLRETFPEREPHVDVVWEPGWSWEMVSEEGRRKLGR